MPKKQKSGLYRARIKLGTDPDGKDIRKYISARTKVELEEKRRQVIEYYITGTGFEEDVMFGPYAQEWYRVRKAPFVSPASQQSYKTALNKDILPVFELRHLRSIRPLDLQEFINKYRGLSLTKITILYATLNSIFENACADRILDKNPMDHIRKPKTATPTVRKTLRPEDRKRVEAVCTSHPRGAYLAAMYYLGCRPGEARGLQWGDFDWTTNQVHIQRDIDYKDGCKAGSLKTAKSDRWVPVPDKLRAILGPTVGPDSAFCFLGELGHGPIAKASGERLWVEFMRDAGLVEPVGKEEARKYSHNDIRKTWRPLVTPYALRHNYITMCWENGIDAYITMKLVGHASIKTTMDIYTHLSDAQMHKAKHLVDDMFK